MKFVVVYKSDIIDSLEFETHLFHANSGSVVPAVYLSSIAFVGRKTVIRQPWDRRSNPLPELLVVLGPLSSELM